MSEYIIAKESDLLVVRSQTQTKLSISFIFAPPHQQRLLTSLGIYGNVVFDDKSGFNGILSNSYSFKTTSYGIISLIDTTKIIDSISITFTGSATIYNVSLNKITFYNGTVSNLKFKDTLNNNYEFPICEKNGYVLHNIQTTCNASFNNFNWYLANENFSLITNNFEILNNVTNTKEVDIVKKANGSSNYVS